LDYGKIYDAAVIGAGAVGALTARALTKYELSICLVEKHSQAGYETSKANSAIVHGGYDCTPGTNKAVYNVMGNAMMERTCGELGVEYERCGSFVIAFNEDEKAKLPEMLEQGLTNGVEGLSIIDGDRARELEPNLSEDVVSALWCESAGIISSYKLARRAALNAEQNGLAFFKNHEVIKIENESGAFIIVCANGSRIRAKYIVNAAGVFADEISKMAGDGTFSVSARKGEYILYDKEFKKIVKRVIFQMPSEFGKGVLVSPTTGGTILVGPNADGVEVKYDVETTAQGQDSVYESARRSVPGLQKRGMITSFAGLRAIADTNDFILGQSPVVPNLIQAAGIQSPGLTSSPAIAEHIAGLVAELTGAGVNHTYDPRLPETPHIAELPKDEIEKLIRKNLDYGHVICRCETVSKAEIVIAIRNGADDVDSVKQECRAGMGRCQGGFCMPRVLEIIAAETGRAFTEVTKNGRGSRILREETKMTARGGE